jgi:hypothetical protein
VSDEMKKTNILKGLLLAISLGVGCQAIAQTNTTVKPRMSALQQIDPNDPGDPPPPGDSPTQPTNPSPGGQPGPIYQLPQPNERCLDRTSGKGDSTCFSGTILTSAAPTTKNFQASSITPFNNPGKSCTTPWGQVISDNSEVAAFQSSTGSYNYATGTYAADCVEEQRHCTNGVLSGTYQYQNCSITPVNGTCGAGNGAYYTYPTSGPSVNDQCNPAYTYGGVPPPDESPPSTPATSGAFLNTTSNMYSWTCAGEAGGSSASCYAYRRINGQCGASTNSCDLGNSASPSTTNNYYPNYKCSCTTNSSGVTTCSANPSGNQMCTGGYKDTTYSWSCTGINTGSTASCNSNTYIPANNTPFVPPCGGSNQAETAACGSGYSGNQTRTNYVDNCNATVVTYGTWNRSSCVCVPSTINGSETAACGTGFTGNQTRTTATNSCTGAVAYGSWNRSACVCSPTYANGSETTACPAGYTGNQTRSTSTNSCTGAVTYGSWNTSSCAVACTSNSYTEAAACPAGYNGTQYRTRTDNTCSGTSYSPWDTSGCSPIPAGPVPTINSADWYTMNAGGVYEQDPWGGSIILSDCRYMSPDSRCNVQFKWNISNATSIYVECTGAWNMPYQYYTSTSNSSWFGWTDPPQGTTERCTITATNANGTNVQTYEYHAGN